MARVVRTQGPVMLAMGAGILLGSGLTLLMHRLTFLATREIRILFDQIDGLHREVRELKASIDRLLQLPKPKSNAVSSVSKQHASTVATDSSSTGEEQDLFEDALENGSDYLSALSCETVRKDKSAPSSEPQETATSRVDLFSGVDRRFDGTDREKEEAYYILKEKYAATKLDSGNQQFVPFEYCDDPEYLWRLAKSSYQLAQIHGSRNDDEEKKSLIYRSREYAFDALSLEPANSSIQKWCAITIGSVGDYESTVVRIENGFKFKEHIEKAIDLCPGDPSAHHLLGRWCYGVYMLSWIERQAAATLFAMPPTASIDEALTAFMEAEHLKSGTWKDNLLFIAKCHIAKGDYYSAVKWLDKADDVPAMGHEDETSQKEVDKLLYSYSGYRRL